MVFLYLSPAHPSTSNKWQPALGWRGLLVSKQMADSTLDGEGVPLVSGVVFVSNWWSHTHSTLCKCTLWDAALRSFGLMFVIDYYWWIWNHWLVLTNMEDRHLTISVWNHPSSPSWLSLSLSLPSLMNHEFVGDWQSHFLGALLSCTLAQSIRPRIWIHWILGVAVAEAVA